MDLGMDLGTDLGMDLGTDLGTDQKVECQQPVRRLRTDPKILRRSTARFARGSEREARGRLRSGHAREAFNSAVQWLLRARRLE